MSRAAQNLNIYRGGGGLRPHLGFPPSRSAASPRWGLGGGQRGKECLPSQVEALPLRVSPLPCAWALGGLVPLAH